MNAELMPITDAVYGKKPKSKPAEYEAHDGSAPIWRRVTDTEMTALAERLPRARRYAARRKQ